MRFAPLAFAILAIPCLAGPLHAREPHVDVSLPLDGSAREVSGTSEAGQTMSYRIKSATTRMVKFSLQAKNENCGAEMRTSLKASFMPGFDRFPTSTSADATEGETFTLSFFQTRSAWVNKTPCAFSFTVQ